MACPRQMYNNLMFIAISISVVTSQDILGKRLSGRACYMPSVCAHTNLSCQTDEKVLINDILYKAKQHGNCGNSCPNNSCCSGEKNLTDHATQNLNKLQIHQLCSGKQNCTLLLPHYTLTTGGKVTTMNVRYYCIAKGNIINYCEEVTYINTTVHIMYNGQHDHHVNRDCYCSIHADYDIDLYSVDIRLQQQDSASPQCTNTTLKWGYNQTENVEKCTHSGDHSRFRKLMVTKDMWVQLSIQDEHPTMVWIAAKATSGTVNVTCGQRNSNTLGTTTTLSASSHTTTINTKTQSIPSAITSKSDSGSTTVTGSAISPNGSTTVQLLDQSVNTTVAAIGLHSTTLSTTSTNTTINARTQSISSAIVSTSNSVSTTVTGSTMSPTVSTTVQLHEPSANTTVTAIGPHSQNIVSANDRNIGSIVGSVIGIIIIAVLVVIGLIFLRRRKAKQQSSQSTTTRDYGGSTGLSKNASDNITYGYDISAYDISKPIVTPTRSTTTIGEPVALFTSLDDSCKQSDENAISDVVDDVYSEVNTKDMVSDNPSRNDNSESDYNHLHGLKACATNAHSGNVYSHFKTSLRDTSPSNDGYDHFGCNKPNSLNENKVNSLSSNDYDHMSSINMKNVTDYNHPTTTHTQQATAEDAMVNINGNRYTPGGVCAVNSSHQIEPSCEYAKVQRRKPVAVSDYEMAEILTDAEV